MSTIADALKATVTWDAVTKTVTLTRGSKRIAFIHDTDIFTALGTHFIPIRRTVEGLGGAVLSIRGSIRIVIV